MGNRWKLLIGILVTAAIITAAIVHSVVSSRIPLNDADVVGSLPGNLLNGGYFCELGGTVYFTNTEDSHTLYSMRADESDFKRLGSTGVRQLCAAGDFLYFSMSTSRYSSGKGLGYIGNTSGVFRMRIRNGESRSLDRATVRDMQLCGSYLYYTVQSADDVGLYKARIDGADKRKISDSLIVPAGFDGHYLYYAGVNGDPSLYSMNTWVGDTESKVLDGNISSPIPSGDFVYYIDNTQDYRICRLNRTTGASETIGEERVDFYNTNGIYIWYATSVGDTPALKRMNMNGSDVRVLVEGVYSNINLTSRYVYFAPFSKDEPGVLYHLPIESTGPAERFAPPILTK